MDYNMVGPVMALTLSTIGSSIGCYIAGIASHAAMSRTDEGHGKFIGLAAAPASQSIYGFILMLLMSKAILAGTLSPISGVAMGLFAGVSIGLSSIVQGRVCATGIQATLKNPSLFGKCFASIGVIESFSLFTFVFCMLIM
jgi:V/A-type H+/Na+-transporting ATPase subunit K